MNAGMGRIEYVERLSLHEQFRLIEIAHETTDREIKLAALRVLEQYLNPLVLMMPTDPLEKDNGQ